MSRENKRDLLKIGCAIIAIALFFALRYVYLSYSIDNQVPQCKELSPRTRPLAPAKDLSEGTLEIEEKLDFSQKKRIGWKKYGFRKKIEVKQNTIFYQGIVENLGQEHLFYGVYKDSQLKKIVAEVSMKYFLEASAAIEMGAPEEDYPDYGPGHTVALKPGTYYLAVYSTAPTEKQTILFESWQANMDTELTLTAGKWGYFFSAGNGHKTYFRINVEEATSLTVDDGQNKLPYSVWLCDVQKKPISKAILSPLNASDKVRQKTLITVPEPGTYYLCIEDNYEKPRIWPLNIRYKLNN